jgi:hypothetical protein
MRRVTVGLVVVFATSLAGNAFLLATPDASSKSRRASRLRSIVRAPCPTTAADTSAAIDPTLPCEERVVALQRRIAEIEMMTEDVLRASDRFARDTRSPETEAKVKPFFERVFANAPESFSYTVECRGRVCKVDATGDRDFDWIVRVQEDDWERLFARKEFSHRSTFLEIDDHPSRSKVAVVALIESFRTSNGVEACKKAHPMSGEHHVVVAIHSGAFVAAVSGDGSPITSCFDAILQGIVAAAPPPRGLADHQLSFRMVPP